MAQAQERMLFRVLGPVQVESGGRILAPGPPRQRALLGVLLLHHGRVVSTARLVEALWGTTPPRTAAHSLQTYVSGLRSVLGPERIATRAPGYVLHVDDAELDVCHFERLVEEGAAALAARDAATAVDRLELALSWWRGDPLADVAAQLSSVGEVARLEELHLRALEDWAAGQLALGGHETLLPELERLTRDHPLRERLWAHRLLALYRSGRGAEALRAYQELRDTLARELGTDPSPQLATLFERMLIQDPHLDLEPDGAQRRHQTAAPARNPYKGLRPFTEADSQDFFGRDELVRDMMAVLAEPGRRLLAVVGPSGSGKSSVVAAGLVPALRQGALPGCDDPFVSTVLPGDDPLGRLEDALGSLARSPTETGTDLVPSAATPARPLPGNDRFLVIDQLEELFTLHRDPTTHRRFLDLVDDTLGSDDGLRVVVTLRSDCFDHALRHPGLGRRITTGTVAVLPLTTEQLAAAATVPARQVDVEVEPALVAALVADLADQPGALPLFQYALTELFERRRDGLLTVEAYRAVGGIEGAVSRRAEELHSRLTAEERSVARQLFLRLVQPGGRDRDHRRRIAASELAALDVDPVALQHVLDRFVGARLLSFDRDSSGAPTVEVAHDALLDAWGRLGSWIDEARDDLQRRATLANAIAEWRRADEDPDYLLRGARLADYQLWASSTTLRLTAPEQRYLAASTARRDDEEAAELARGRTEERLRSRARRRLWGLTAATAALLLLGGGLVWAAFVDAPPHVVLVYDGGGDRGVNDLYARGLALIDRTFDVRTEEVVPLTSEAAEIAELCASGVDLLFLGGWNHFEPGMAAAGDCPDTLLVMLDADGLEDAELAGNLLPVTFATEEGSFLAGARAALSTETDVVGFVGGMPSAIIDRFRAGFEAGAHHVDPDIEVLAIYLTDRANPETGFSEAFMNEALGRIAGRQLYGAGADVVFPAAGVSGRGVAEAARELSTPIQHLWVIGVDSDWSVTQPAARQPHVLTSVLKRMDLAMLDTMQDFADGHLTSAPRRYGLRADAVQLSSEGPGAGDPERVDDLRRRIAAGELHVPHVPTGPTLPAPTAAFPPASAEVSFSGDACRYQGPSRYVEGTALEIAATNASDGVAFVIAFGTLEPPPRWTEPTVGREPPSWVDRWSAVVVEVPAGDGAHARFVGGTGTAVVVCQTVDPETGTTLTWWGAEIEILPGGTTPPSADR